MSALRCPPSIGMCAPLRKLARGEARNATRLATSCGVQIRPSGIEETARSCAVCWSQPLSRANAFSRPSQRSVSTGPGLTVFTRMPFGPYCSASDDAKFRSAAFAAPAVISQ